MSSKNLMHPRNPYRNRPNFKELALKYPEFRQYAKQVSKWILQPISVYWSYWFFFPEIVWKNWAWFQRSCFCTCFDNSFTQAGLQFECWIATESPSPHSALEAELFIVDWRSIGINASQVRNNHWLRYWGRSLLHLLNYWGSEEWLALYHHWGWWY